MFITFVAICFTFFPFWLIILIENKIIERFDIEMNVKSEQRMSMMKILKTII